MLTLLEGLHTEDLSLKVKNRALDICNTSWYGLIYSVCVLYTFKAESNGHITMELLQARFY